MSLGLKDLRPNISDMLHAIWSAHRQDEAALIDRMHAYFLACARKIFVLLPDKDSRKGIELAEKYLSGSLSKEKLQTHDYYSEGAAFGFDYASEEREYDAQIFRWIDECNNISARELQSLLNTDEPVSTIDRRELLNNAAYFANYAMMYPFISSPHQVNSSYHIFLSTSLLVEMLDTWEAGV